MQQTRGISPKAVAALVWPAVVAAGIAVASWITTGDFSDSEIRVALAGVVTSLITFAGAYVAEPGPVEKV